MKFLVILVVIDHSKTSVLILNRRFRSSSVIMDLKIHNLAVGQVELRTANKHFDYTLQIGSFVEARI